MLIGCVQEWRKETRIVSEQELLGGVKKVKIKMKELSEG